MGVDTTIYDAMMDRLRDLVLSPALPISWENHEPYEETDGMWIDVSMNRDPIRGQTIDRWPLRTGFMTVTVVSAQNEGASEALSVAETIQSWFPVNLRLPSGDPVLRVSETPSIADGFPDESRWRTPVTVYFESYAKEI